jgi:exonuclease VII small subunit
MVAGNEDHLDAITMELELAIEHYERAIEQLQFVAASAGKPLDTDVAAAIETGLATLDQAIAESRRALRADPSSAAARLSLLDALRQKVHVLELTARALDRPQVSRQPLLRVSAGRLT